MKSKILLLLVLVSLLTALVWKWSGISEARARRKVSLGMHLDTNEEKTLLQLGDNDLIYDAFTKGSVDGNTLLAWMFENLNERIYAHIIADWNTYGYGLRQEIAARFVNEIEKHGQNARFAERFLESCIAEKSPEDAAILGDLLLDSSRSMSETPRSFRDVLERLRHVP